MRSDYGAHAVIELARRAGQGPVQCAEIAACQKIPEAYLDQLLSSLRRVGIVRSVRGPHGGHELARDPRQLTLGDVVTALEGTHWFEVNEWATTGPGADAGSSGAAPHAA